MHTSLVRPSDSAWRSLLRTLPHDVYHTPEYATLEADRLGGDPYALIVEDDDQAMLIPLVVRPLPAQLGLDVSHDATSPYGYPGPVFSDGTTEAFRDRAGAALVSALGEAGICSVFVRVNPLTSERRGLLGSHGTFASHGSTVWLDLTTTEEEYMAAMRSTTRNLIRRTIRDGYSVRMDESDDALDEFHALYTATMERLDAAEEYFFARDYLHSVREAWKEHFHLCVVELNGEMMGAAIFFDSPIAVQYHLSAAVRTSGPASPTRLVIHHARQFFAERGRSKLHLGGGLGSEEDSLFAFKAGFSPLRAQFETWRSVTDPAVFDSAVAAWSRLAGAAAEEDLTGWFPPYRRKVES